MSSVNYTEEDEITIDDIKDTPISTGYGYTFGTVFGALNKIIKAIVKKFKSVDDEMNILHNGKTGDYKWDISLNGADSKENTSTIKEIIVDSSRRFTHGYIKSDKGIDFISELRSPVSLDYTNSGTYGNGGSKGRAYISCELTHDNGGTQLKVAFRSGHDFHSFEYKGYEFSYELY